MTEQAGYKKLFRSRTDKKIAGICAGLGTYFQVDPFLFRLIFILFFLAGGTALLIYLIMWLIVPLEPMTSTDKDKVDITKTSDVDKKDHDF